MVEFEIGLTSQGSQKRKIAVAFVASTGALCIGSVLGWTAPALRSITKSNLLGELNPDQKSWVVFSVLIGAAFGYPVATFLLQRMGRRITMLSISVTLILAWIIMSCADGLITLNVGRVISGLCAEGIVTVIPIYVNEISSKESPKFLKYLHLVFCEVGILLSFIIGMLVDWLWFSVLCALIPMVFICCMVYMPETPYHFLALGKYRLAQKSLTWLNGALDSFEMNQDLSEIKVQLEEDGLAPVFAINFKEILNPKFIKPLVISSCLVFLQVFSGIFVFIFYPYEILDLFYVKNILNNEVASVFLISLLVVSVISSVFIDEVWNSQKVLCISCMGASAFMGTLSTCNYLNVQPESGSERRNVISWIGLISLAGFVSFYGIGLASAPWKTMQRITPIKYKGWIFGVLSSLKWILAILAIQLFHKSYQYLGLGVFWIFSGVNCVGFLLTGFMMLIKVETVN